MSWRHLYMALLSGSTILCVGNVASKVSVSRKSWNLSQTACSAASMPSCAVPPSCSTHQNSGNQKAEEKPSRAELPTYDEDDIDIPAFLRRK